MSEAPIGAGGSAGGKEDAFGSVDAPAMGLSDAVPSAGGATTSGGVASVSAVHALQEQLERAGRFREQIRRDYDSIRVAYTQLKQSHDELLQAFHEQKSQTDAALQAKQAVEKECETLYKQWHEQLKTQAEEFQQLQSQMVPSREVELLRVQLLKDLEAPHQQRLDAITEEMNRFRDAFHKEHRELELLKTQLDQERQTHQQALQQRNAEHDAAMAELAGRNRKLQHIIEDSGADSLPAVLASTSAGAVGGSLAERWRSLDREHSELLLKHKQFVAELDQLRAEKEAAMVAKEETVLFHMRQQKESEGRVAQLEREKAAASRKADALASELAGAQQRLRDVEDRVLRLQKECVTLEQQLTARTAELKSRNEASGRRVMELEQSLEDERKSHAATVEKLKSEIRDHARAAQESSAQLQQLERDHAANVKAVRDEEARKHWELEKTHARLEAMLSEAERKLIDTAAVHEAELNTRAKELEHVRDTLRDAVAERNRATERWEQLYAQHESLKTDTTALTNQLKELELEHQSVQQQLRDVRQLLHDTTMVKDRAETERAFVKEELVAAQKDTEEERRRQLELFKSNQSAWLHERSVLAARVSELEQALSSLQNTLQSTNVKLKKDKNKYKRLAASLTAKLTNMNKETAALKKEVAVVAQAKSYEIKALQRRLKETEAQRDELKSRLIMSGVPIDSFSLAVPAAAASPRREASAATLPASLASVLEDSQQRQEIGQMMARLDAVAAAGGPQSRPVATAVPPPDAESKKDDSSSAAALPRLPSVSSGSRLGPLPSLAPLKASTESS